MAGSIAKMVAAATAIDKANTGYDQWQRWSFFDRATKKIIPNKEGDCSSVCGAIAALGGYNVNLNDPFYTGTFRQRLVAAGFTAIKFTSLSQLKTGDFILNTGYHVEFVPSPGMMFSANIDEKGGATGGQAGDQTGREVYFKKAYIYSRGWDWILRPPAEATSPSKTVTQVAQEVIEGKWGNGNDRVSRLKAAGYDASAVQKEVNRILAGSGSAPAKSVAVVAKEVIDGKWGNGQDRINRLTKAGYNASAVQAEVNKQLASSKKSVNTIAKEVIAGKWGNGADRVSRLTKAGYNASAVQAEVNRILKG